MIPALKPLRGMKVVLADKGYDSEENVAYVASRGACGLIAVRKNVKTGLRRQMKKYFNHPLYRLRWVAEYVFSAMKRKFGDYLSSRKEENRGKEALLTCVAYNAYRKSVWVIELFYRVNTVMCIKTVFSPLNVYK